MTFEIFEDIIKKIEDRIHRGSIIKTDNGEIFCDDSVAFNIGSYEISLNINENWQTSGEHYLKSKRKKYLDNQFYVLPRSIECAVSCLSATPNSKTFEFKDTLGNIVKIAPASDEFVLAKLIHDPVAQDAFLGNIKNFAFGAPFSSAMNPNSVTGGVISMPINSMLHRPYTATYISASSVSEKTLVQLGQKKIEACFFKLAYHGDICFTILHPPKVDDKVLIIKHQFSESNAKIPIVTYNPHLIAYYKIAKSSPFASQSFLSYYHILEYGFLKVADEELRASIKQIISSPSFNINDESIDQIISKTKIRNYYDETEMLKLVLQKYISEEELINKIETLEKIILDDKFYTQKRHIFGKDFCIDKKNGHALNNTAAIVKHIRDALVHSSNKYNTIDFFKPLSPETDTIIHNYLPIMDFLAEKVISATAVSME